MSFFQNPYQFAENDLIHIARRLGAESRFDKVRGQRGLFWIILGQVSDQNIRVQARQAERVRFRIA